MDEGNLQPANYTGKVSCIIKRSVSIKIKLTTIYVQELCSTPTQPPLLGQLAKSVIELEVCYGAILARFQLLPEGSLWIKSTLNQSRLSIVDRLKQKRPIGSFHEKLKLKPNGYQTYCVTNLAEVTPISVGTHFIWCSILITLIKIEL